MGNKKDGTESSTAQVIVRGGAHTSSVIQKILRSKILKIVLLIILLACIVGAYVIMQKPATEDKPVDMRPYNVQLADQLKEAQAQVSNFNGQTPKNAAERKKLAEAYIKLGSAQSNTDQKEAAVGSYINAVAVDPDHKQYALTGLISAYDAVGQRQLAIDTTKELLQILSKQKQDVETQRVAAAYKTVLSRLESGQKL